ncbi:hypothetical protein L3X38_028282 [Prunus dulcis]|uniref:GAG-pre-integrase domain-containing protein n=1 Tax=Prunus dulcis TaxID=3755 RepID=A0AAD4Z148_PRUDU|nr:hypothetical protein L3X38_028282 [Prunus dulcis]
MSSSSSTSSLKIESLLGMLTICLSEDNYLNWSYQLESVLQGYDLFGHLDGSVTSPPKFAILDEEAVTAEVNVAYKEWLCTDKALMSLLIASLSDEAFESASYGPSFGQGLLPTPVQGPVGYGGSNMRFSGPRPNFNSNYGRGSFGSGKSGSSQFRPSSAGFRNGFSTNKSAIPECQICSKYGHTTANCYHRHSSPNPTALSMIIECQICGKKMHGALDCYHRSNCAFQGQSPPSSLTAMTAQLPTILIKTSSLRKFCSKARVARGSILHCLCNLQFLCRLLYNILSRLSQLVAFLGHLVKSSMWRHRFGHPTNEVVKYMLKAAQLPYCDDSRFFVCSDCLNGKMHKLP